MGTLLVPPTARCTALCFSIDDISGLSANAIKLEADGIQVFGIAGDPLTLGSGGLTADEPSGRGQQEFAPTIVLAAPQTWSIVHGQLNLISVNGAEPLGIVFGSPSRNHPVALGIANVEVGAITASGPGSIDLAGTPQAALNATDGDPALITGGAALSIASNASTGPLAFRHGFLDVNDGYNAAVLNGGGSISLDSKSGVTLIVKRAGTSPGVDYAQVRAEGPVSIGDAGLRLSGPIANQFCPRLRRGNIETLITTTGALSGTFSAWNPIKRAIYKVRNGTTVPINCVAGSDAWNFKHAPRVRINYAPHKVTATVVRAVATR